MYRAFLIARDGKSLPAWSTARELQSQTMGGRAEELLNTKATVLDVTSPTRNGGRSDPSGVPINAASLISGDGNRLASYVSEM